MSFLKGLGSKASDMGSKAAGYGQQAMNMGASAKAAYEAAEKKYHETFKTFDKDGNGRIEAADLKECVKAMGLGDTVPDSSLQEIADKATKETGGTISWDEFKEKVLPLPTE